MKYQFLTAVFLLIWGTHIQSATLKTEGEISAISWEDIKLTHFSKQEKPSVLIVSCRDFTPQNKDGVLFRNQVDKHQLPRYFKVIYNAPFFELDTLQNLKDGIKLFDNQTDILFFVHGHGKEFTDVLTNAYRLSERYGVNVIAFDWPSKNGSLNRSLTNVRHSMPAFMQTLVQLNDIKRDILLPSTKISIVMHSLGNYFLIRLIKMHKVKLLSENGNLFNNIILNSAAIKQRNHEIYLNKIKATSPIVIIQNRNDFILHGAQLLMWSNLLGVENKHSASSKAVYVDFSKVVDKQHSYFLGVYEFEQNNCGIKQFYNTLFHGDTININNTKQFQPREDNLGYYFITNRIENQDD